MAGITETTDWEDVIYQLETTDPVEGGEDGVDNFPHKQLAARTQYLKAQIEAIFTALEGGVDAGTLQGYDLNAIKTQIIDDITNGASEAYDTLLELQAAIQANDGDISGILSTLASKANAGDLLLYVPKTGIQNTDDWNGVAYVDPDAIGANPQAKIYPDGTIVGSTDNGSYIKYPNGELLCTGISAAQYTTSNAETGIYRTSTITMDYPIAFITIKELIPFARRLAGAGATWGAINGDESLTSIDMRLFGVVSYSTAHAAYRVRGTWK